MEQIDKISSGESSFDLLSITNQQTILDNYENQTGNETLSVDEMEVFYEWYYETLAEQALKEK